MENQDKKKEVDLVDIFRSIFRYLCLFFQKIIDFIKWGIRFLYKTKWILLFFILCGIAFSFYMSRPSNLQYNGEAEIRFNMYDSYFYKNLLNPLNGYCENENKKPLANILNITPEQAAQITQINSYFYIDLLNDGTPDEIDRGSSYKKPDTLTSRMKDRLLLVVTTKDTSLFSIMKDRLKTYIVSNPVVQEENTVRLKQVDEKIAEIDNEITLLDSFRRIEYFKKNMEARARLENAILLNEKEKKLYHNDILSLENVRQKLTWEKEINNESIRFLSDFKIDLKPVNRITRSLKKYVPISFILGCFFALGWRYRRSIYNSLTSED